MEGEVTRLLRRTREGDREALNQLFKAVEPHLEAIARARMRGERADHTLQTRGLMHDAFMKMVELNEVDLQDRDHFYAIASTFMKRILVNYARYKNAEKRGGGVPDERISKSLNLPITHSDDILDLHDALERLQKEHDRPAQVVELRYLCGHTNKEVASILGVALSTVERDLRFAKAWLAKEWNSTN